jgi:RNA polymerase sigma factor (sigma-70 family)
MASTFVDESLDRAFERLYERYVHDVYRYVLAVLRNPSEAEDVTQTTFMNAYRALRAGEQPQKPHNWLIAIAHNACRSRIRWRMRRPREVPLDAALGEIASADAERPNVTELTRALRRLPSNQRTAITMRELEGRSYSEIADSLGVSVPAVESLISRARRSLRVHAAALRGLTLLQLPRSLRKLFESGEALTGGGAGAGALAKAAAVLVAVAGGVGYVAGDARTPPPPRAGAQQPEAPLATIVPARSAPAGVSPAAHPPRRAAPARPVTAGAPTQRTHTTTTTTGAARGDESPAREQGSPASVPQQAAPQAPAQQQEQPTQQQGDVVTTVRQVGADAAQTVPVTTPVTAPVTVPEAALPPAPPPTTVPAVPALPPPPPSPSLPPAPSLPPPPAPLPLP